MAFHGTFEHSLDAKNRLTIPAKLRDALGEQIVVGNSLDSCGAIWTPEGFDANTELYVAGLHPLSQEARDLTTYFSANAFGGELDKAGRAMIPGAVLAHAEIEKDVIIVGARDHIQIWHPDAWRERSSAVKDTILTTVAATVARNASAG